MRYLVIFYFFHFILVDTYYSFTDQNRNEGLSKYPSLLLFKRYYLTIPTGYAEARIASGNVYLWDASEEALQDFASFLLFARGILLSAAAAGRLVHLRVTFLERFLRELDIHGIRKSCSFLTIMLISPRVLQLVKWSGWLDYNPD